jgi:hypothetical protein
MGTPRASTLQELCLLRRTRWASRYRWHRALLLHPVHLLVAIHTCPHPSGLRSGDPGNDSFVGNFPDVNTEDVIPTASVDTFLRCVFGPVGTHRGGHRNPGSHLPHSHHRFRGRRHTRACISRIWLWGNGLLSWLRVPPAGVYLFIDLVSLLYVRFGQ